jgi:hypothetical protein
MAVSDWLIVPTGDRQTAPFCTELLSILALGKDLTESQCMFVQLRTEIQTCRCSFKALKLTGSCSHEFESRPRCYLCAIYSCLRLRLHAYQKRKELLTVVGRSRGVAENALEKKEEHVFRPRSLHSCRDVCPL